MCIGRWAARIGSIEFGPLFPQSAPTHPSAYPPQRLRTPVYRQPSAAAAHVTMNSATIT
ncbi:Uncharacterised protein [Mycobacteroides abscessus]|nr:Uncharacterised protein [Mycobacteroides abscessus]SHZ21610.1 Uncharacterised protein [Mycobacteroides abscessus subsp. abscessus]CPZ68414.1 Uncharacterised protein [Mycobacteroides abscessus]SHZ77794.1 Uncharacterised protein [Mycobacteroides abscessus subsp. abscessus]SIB59210.1 Uncharacterised protein [Mycobacteroides abscessus subsp. abscessus]